MHPSLCSLDNQSSAQKPEWQKPLTEHQTAYHGIPVKKPGTLIYQLSKGIKAVCKGDLRQMRARQRQQADEGESVSAT